MKSGMREVSLHGEMKDQFRIFTFAGHAVHHNSLHSHGFQVLAIFVDHFIVDRSFPGQKS